MPPLKQKSTYGVSHRNKPLETVSRERGARGAVMAFAIVESVIAIAAECIPSGPVDSAGSSGSRFIRPSRASSGTTLRLSPDHRLNPCTD